MFPTRHKLLLTPLVLSAVAACAGAPTQAPAPALAPAPSPEASKLGGKGVETLTRTLHPSGPTTRREWRSAPDAPVSRIEVTHARSGYRLIGNVRLQRLQDGAWQVLLPAGPALALATDAGAQPLVFEDAGRRWALVVDKAYLPVVRPGVSTETEPHLDLRLLAQ